MGDGEAGKALNPPPAVTAYMIEVPMSVDEYLMRTIAESGKAFGTDMPSFKGPFVPEKMGPDGAQLLTTSHGGKARRISILQL
jgi:hypothetical protein